MKFLFLASLFVLAACCTMVLPSNNLVQQDEVNREPYPIESSDIDFYIRLFKNEAKVFNKDVSKVDNIRWMVFEDKRTYVGLCKSEAKYNTIYIDSNWWDLGSAYDKQALIFHELGHCVLNRAHIDTKLTFSDNAQHSLSLMHPTVVLGADLQKFYNYYIKELFLGSANYYQHIDENVFALPNDKTYTLADVNNAACQSACSAYHGTDYQYDGGSWVPNTDPVQCFCYDYQKLSELTHKLIKIPSHPKKHEIHKDTETYYPSYKYFKNNDD